MQFGKVPRPRQKDPSSQAPSHLEDKDPESRKLRAQGSETEESSITEQLAIGYIYRERNEGEKGNGGVLDDKKGQVGWNRLYFV